MCTEKKATNNIQCFFRKQRAGAKKRDGKILLFALDPFLLSSFASFSATFCFCVCARASVPKQFALLSLNTKKRCSNNDKNPFAIDSIVWLPTLIKCGCYCSVWTRHLFTFCKQIHHICMIWIFIFSVRTEYLLVFNFDVALAITATFFSSPFSSILLSLVLVLDPVSFYSFSKFFLLAQEIAKNLTRSKNICIQNQFREERNKNCYFRRLTKVFRNGNKCS